jgi:enediyne polyketide synthase
MHAIQACIPQARLLPVGVAGIQRRPAASPGIVRIQARERQQDGLVYVYDVDFLSETDEVVEAWTGLRLRRLEDLPQPSVWPGPLLANYLERKLGQWLPPLSIALGFGDPRERLARGTQLIASILGRAVRLSRRPDGRPEVAWAEGSAPDAVFPAVSLAHAAGLTFAVAGTGPDPVGCDVEPVQARSSAVWLDLLGADRFALAGFVAAQAAEDLDVAGTRVWTVRESLRKAGFAETTPLVFDSAGTDGWVRFRSGSRVSATLATRVRGAEGPVVFACVGGQVGTRVAERATSGAAGAAPHAVGAGS